MVKTRAIITQNINCFYHILNFIPKHHKKSTDNLPEKKQNARKKIGNAWFIHKKVASYISYIQAI